MKKLTLICLSLLFMMSGCLTIGDGGGLTGTYTVGNKLNDGEQTCVILYFGDKDRGSIVPESRAVYLNNENIEEEILEELIKGPQSVQLCSVISDKTKLIYVKLKNKRAYVNLSSDFKENSQKDLDENNLSVTSIVNSLTMLPHIISVQFLIEGKKWGYPLKRFRNLVNMGELTPSETLKKQMTLEKEGDWLNSYMLMSDSEKSNGRKSYNEYIDEIKEAKEDGLLEADFEVGDYKIDPKDKNKAIVKVNFIIRDSDGKYYKSPDVFFSTVKIDGHWKVDWLVHQGQ